MKLHQTEAGATIDLEAGEIPGSIVRDGDLYFPVAGKYYLVTAVQFDRKYGLVPILDMGTPYTPTGGHPAQGGGQEDVL